MKVKGFSKDKIFRSNNQDLVDFLIANNLHYINKINDDYIFYKSKRLDKLRQKFLDSGEVQKL